MIRYCKSILLFLFVTFNFSILTGQPTISEAHLEAMAKLDFLTGDWEGNGWMYVQGGQKVTFEQTEKVQWKLDKSIVMIEGKGISEGTTIHDALAVISYDPNASAYQFQSWLANGLSGQYRVEVTGEQSLVWFLEVPGRTIRYTLVINEKGQWFEIGEFKTGEDSWYKFLEMTLDKK